MHSLTVSKDELHSGGDLPRFSTDAYTAEETPGKPKTVSSHGAQQLNSHLARPLDILGCERLASDVVLSAGNEP